MQLRRHFEIGNMEEVDQNAYHFYKLLLQYHAYHFFKNYYYNTILFLIKSNIVLRCEKNGVWNQRNQFGEIDQEIYECN